MTRAAGRDWAEWTSLLDGARASGQRDATDALQAAASRLDG